MKFQIKAAREQAGYSQKELARIVGVAPSTFNGYESGTHDPKSDLLMKIARACQVSVDFLLDYDSGAEREKAVTDEAAKVARDYQGLDRWGRQVVRSVIADEQARMADEARLMGDFAPEAEPKVINLFVEPSAAGIAVPTMGVDYEPYELTPQDPPDAAYAVRVQGDSMEPDFPDGSIVFVNHDAMRDGDIGIFSVDGGTVCKQYHQEGGVVYLFSLNRRRQDADIVLFSGGNRGFVCQGRVMTRKRYPVPGRE